MTIDAILRSARRGGGESGDGKIFVTHLEECIRISTGEEGRRPFRRALSRASLRASSLIGSGEAPSTGQLPNLSQEELPGHVSRGRLLALRNEQINRSMGPIAVHFVECHRREGAVLELEYGLAVGNQGGSQVNQLGRPFPIQVNPDNSSVLSEANQLQKMGRREGAQTAPNGFRKRNVNGEYGLFAVGFLRVLLGLPHKRQLGNRPDHRGRSDLGGTGRWEGLRFFFSLNQTGSS